ncbi:hypothetical protein [Psychromonas aquimarina]|uniref:hypothetical protein n=1 Tax=Psychromonas aquimarina TaxID=444919 RepID=UPI0006867F3B|nr:hypothetical protein [Psychromonas aquimarina]
MKKAIAIVVISLSTTIFSYGYAADNPSNGHSNHGVEAPVDGLRLNNGEQWNMDVHTRTISQKMKKTFLDTDHSTQENLNALGVKLQKQVNELIVGCTMNGKSHDQLHIFLNSQIPTINALALADNYNSARALEIQLKGQFETYQKYFK